MNKSLKIVTILIVTGFSFVQSKAQEIQVDTVNTASVKLLIPTLQVLIDSAIENNGMLNYRKLEVEAKKHNLTSKRRNWTRNFGIQSDTRYGTFDNFSSNVSGTNTTTLATTTTQLNYGIGLYLKIPVFDMINRKSEIKRAKAEIDQAESLKISQEDELKEVVIRYYEDLILKQHLLELRSSNLGNARVNMEMVEKEFVNGLIPIYEFVRISDMTARIAAEYENAKSDFLVSKKILENITKVEIN